MTVPHTLMSDYPAKRPSLLSTIIQHIKPKEVQK